MQLEPNLLFSSASTAGWSHQATLDAVTSKTATHLTCDEPRPTMSYAILDHSAILSTPMETNASMLLFHRKQPAKRFTRSQIVSSQPDEPEELEEESFAVERRLDVQNLPIGQRLWHMVNELDVDKPHIIHWSNDGTAFLVSDAKSTVKELMAFLDRYFVRCNSFKSFHRILNRLGFTVKTVR